MHVKDILVPERTLWGIQGESKKRILEQIANFICQQEPSLDANELFDSLISREKLGSTGVGSGIGIPHCRMSHCEHTIGTLIHLKKAIDYDALDDIPVDIIFVLIVPIEASQEHLDLLADLAKIFSDEKLRQTLRASENANELYHVFKDSDDCDINSSQAAAS